MKYIILLLFVTQLCISQNLKDHVWKERVVTIYADVENPTLAEEQLKRFLAQKDEMIDRQIVLYVCRAESCTYYDFKKAPKFKRCTTPKTSFKTFLYGLDGQIKYEANQLVGPGEVFKLIDKMPMRRSEMRKRIKNKGNE